MPSERIDPAANALLDTLRAETVVLEELDELYERQLDALRTNDPDALSTLTMKTQDRAAALTELHQKSERQARLLGRVLDAGPEEPSLEEAIQRVGEAHPDLGTRLTETWTTMAEQVEAVNQRRETLRLALEYATELNHELMVAMQEAATEEDGQTYTAAGQSESGPPSDDRSFVNTTG